MRSLRKTQQAGLRHFIQRRSKPLINTRKLIVLKKNQNSAPPLLRG
jgi:hypothetical protein